MGNLSIWYVSNVSATANISLWGNWVSCFCHLSRSKPYVAGANLMTLLSEHQKSFLKILMSHYDSLKEHLTEVETNLMEDMTPFALQVEQLSSIYGISTTAFCAIIAEIGIDMKPFKTAEHICSWAGLCPSNNESAGKRKGTSGTKGNPYIKSMLCEIA